MKQLLLIISILTSGMFFLHTTTVAISPTPEPTESESQSGELLEKQLDELKDRIASRVAQLNLSEKKGVIGTVTDTSDTLITIDTIQGDQQFIDVDEFTKFSSPSAKEAFGISDITKGTKIGVLGLYNKQSKRVMARFVNVITVPKFLRGAIGEINEDDFYFTLISANGLQTRVDVETVTRTQSYTKENDLERSGFSRLEVGQHVLVVGFPDKKNENQLTATRVLIFPEIPPDPRIQDIPPALEPDTTTVPSTGSGKKLTPLTQ